MSRCRGVSFGAFPVATLRLRVDAGMGIERGAEGPSWCGGFAGWTASSGVASGPATVGSGKRRAHSGVVDPVIGGQRQDAATRLVAIAVGHVPIGNFTLAYQEARDLCWCTVEAPRRPIYDLR